MSLAEIVDNPDVISRIIAGYDGTSESMGDVTLKLRSLLSKAQVQQDRKRTNYAYILRQDATALREQDYQSIPVRMEIVADLLEEN